MRDVSMSDPRLAEVRVEVDRLELVVVVVFVVVVEFRIRLLQLLGRRRGRELGRVD